MLCFQRTGMRLSLPLCFQLRGVNPQQPETVQSANQNEEQLICNRHQAWENTRAHVAIGFSFASH